MSCTSCNYGNGKGSSSGSGTEYGGGGTSGLGFSTASGAFCKKCFSIWWILGVALVVYLLSSRREK